MHFNSYYKFYPFPGIFDIVSISFKILFIIICFAFLGKCRDHISVIFILLKKDFLSGSFKLMNLFFAIFFNNDRFLNGRGYPGFEFMLSKNELMK